MNDLRFACRQLLKSPGFTAVALLTLALGIGGNTAMFSLLNAVMLRALPYPDSERLVRIYRTSPQSQSWPHSVANHLDLRARSQSFEQLAAFSWWTYNLAEPGQSPETLRGVAATADLFPALGTSPALGRVFTAEEDQPGQNDVVVLSHGIWANRFAADTNIIGRRLRLDGGSVTVIGVMPAGFDYPLFWGPVDVWRPLAFSDAQRTNRGDNWLSALGRLKPGVSPAQARAELSLLAARLAQEHPDSNGQDGLRLLPLHRAGMDETGQRVTWMTMGLTVFVLLIACANLANLQFARTAVRTREYAIRAALGAQRPQLIRHTLTESLLLSLIGGGLGLVLAAWLGDLVGRHIWIYDHAGLEIPLAPKVFAFAFLASVLTGIGFGVVPAWLASRADVNDALKPGGRGSTADRSHHRLRHGLIIAEVALSLVLLTGAGLFIRGLEQFGRRNPGWHVDGLLIGHLALSEKKYPTPALQERFAARLEERLAVIPGVERAALAWSLPVWAFSSSDSLAVEGRPDPPHGQEPLAFVNGVSPGYFETLGLRLGRGRNFTRADSTNASRVVIINEAMARQFWPGEDPLGKRIGSPDPNDRGWSEVVGVVNDVNFPGNFSEPDTRLQMYRPLAQEPRGFVVTALRCSVAPESLADTLRRAVAEMDPDQPVAEVASARQSVERILKNYTLTGWILSSFAGLGLLLAGVGIAGVIAGFVTQRTGEIGLRMALGAPVGSVLWLVLGKGLRLAAWGSVLGVGGAVALGRLFARMAPELPAQNLSTVALMAGLLAMVVLLACWLPARRASRVDPMVALRNEG